jgi:hypothetical protein
MVPLDRETTSLANSSAGISSEDLCFLAGNYNACIFGLVCSRISQMATA